MTCAAADPPSRRPRDLFADALRIAYRLLFVAYAEDRGLLPAGTPAYDSGYSLRALRDLAADPSIAWEPDGGYFWAALRAQWPMLHDGVDAGELQIAGFDGGLFDPAKCPLLDDPGLVIGDDAVRDMIDALCWTQPARSVNRRDTSPAAASTTASSASSSSAASTRACCPSSRRSPPPPMALVRLGRGQAAVEQVIDAGQVPEGAEVLATYPPGASTCSRPPGSARDPAPSTRRGSSPTSSSARPSGPLTENATPQQILSLRICDPAMGSGGFLVPAVHWLTEAYGEALARAGEDIDHKLDDRERAAYRRLIVERCIYGVDLNPMAVELAKVSLWLATAAAGKPLSFLDAHLRCGDALIGATIDGWDGLPAPVQTSRDTDIDASSEELTLFDLARPDLKDVVKVRQELAASPSEDRDQPDCRRPGTGRPRNQRPGHPDPRSPQRPRHLPGHLAAHPPASITSTRRPPEAG